MKITFVIPSIDFGGAEIQLIWQIESLKKSGYQVYLIVLGDINARYEDLPAKVDGLLCLKASYTDLTGKAAAQGMKLVPEIAAFISRHNLKLVVANLPFAHFIMRLVKIYLKAKGTTVCLYNYHHALQFEESPLDTLPKKAFNVFNSFLARIADNKSIFISQAVQDNIQRHSFAPNSTIIYNGVPGKNGDDGQFRYYLEVNKIPETGFRIVIPGRLNETKGQLFFIDAFAAFLEQRELKPAQIQVILAGGGVLEKQIVARIREKNLEPYFFITGFIANELLLSFLEKADLVVIPSLVEGLGNVAIEALMVGSTILASDAGGLKEIIREGENGFGFPKNNTAEFLRKFGYLYEHRETPLLNKKRIQEDYKTRFSFDSHISKLIEAFDTCAE